MNSVIDLNMRKAGLRFQISSSGVRGHSIPYRPELDGVRGVAILAVLLNHIGAISHGGWGVDVFFLLSGYLISTILLTNAANGQMAKKFYLRRFARLAPLSIFYVFFGLISVTIVRSKYSLFEMFSALFYFRNFFPFSASPWSHYWSLSAEEQFYFLWPIALALTLKMRKLSALALFSISTFIVLQLSQLFFTFKNSVGYFVFEHVVIRPSTILLGCGIALIEKKLSSTQKLQLNYSLFLCGISLIAIGLTFQNLAWSLGIVLLFSSLLIPQTGKLRFFATALSFNPLTRIGLLSYSIYIWQFCVIKMVNLASTHCLVLKAPLTLAFSLMIGFISFNYFEKPCQNILISKFI